MLFDWVSALGLVGLRSRAIVLAEGTAARSNSSSFGPTSTLNKVAPVTLPPGRFRLATNPICTGSAMVVKTIGIVTRCRFCGASGRRGRRCQDGHLLSDQIGCHRRQSIVLVFRPPVFDPGVLAVFVAGFAKPFEKRVNEPLLTVWSTRSEISDHRYRRALRPRRKRPGRDPAAKCL